MPAKRRAEVLEEFQRSTKDSEQEEQDEVKHDEGSKEQVIEISDSSTEDSDSDGDLPELSSNSIALSQEVIEKSIQKAKGKGKAQENDGPTVMLISLKSGAVGINLTAAQVSYQSGMKSSIANSFHASECIPPRSLVAASYRNASD